MRNKKKGKTESREAGKAEKQGKTEKRRSREAAQWISREAKKQRSRGAETWRSREAKNYRSRKGGKNRKTRSKEAEKQRNRETEIPKKCPKRKRNSSPKRKLFFFTFLVCFIRNSQKCPISQNIWCLAKTQLKNSTPTIFQGGSPWATLIRNSMFVLGPTIVPSCCLRWKINKIILSFPFPLLIYTFLCFTFLAPFFLETKSKSFSKGWTPANQGISVGFPWNFFWISMIFLWYYYWISMGFLWNFRGVSMIFLEDFYGISEGVL